MPKQCFLFVGNPGTGKSTLLNGLAGACLFKSGTSVTGTGVTFKFDKREVQGLGVLMDTPGLEDNEKKELAAEAITEALKQDGEYRIFFVVCTQAGRIAPADKATMQLILTAAPTLSRFNIIVNKISAKWFKKLTADPEQFCQWRTALTSGLPVPTDSIKFILEDEDLKDEDDVEYKAPQEVVDFILGAKAEMINKEDVKNVEVDQIQKLVEENERLQKMFEEDKEKLQREMEQQRQFFELQQERDREFFQRQQEEANEQVKNLRETFQEQVQEMRSQVEKAEAERQRVLEAERAMLEEDKKKELAKKEKEGAKLTDGAIVYIKDKDGYYLCKNPRDTYCAAASKDKQDAARFKIHFDDCCDREIDVVRQRRAIRIQYHDDHTYLGKYTFLYAATTGSTKYDESILTNSKQFWFLNADFSTDLCYETEVQFMDAYMMSYLAVNHTASASKYACGAGKVWVEAKYTKDLLRGMQINFIVEKC